ncbi:calcium-binding protein [Sphaerotilus sp.]|uniref:calcium-binding protein n=1 Tax=Sphaerotilus sp. TaxID=2093942 RepID=UPI002ACDD6EF|nr:calcium-binding protein [Sphaerotilus sp.]MDZ7855644.1 calcium-binding protein [Sphaerotilus sp.]
MATTTATATAATTVNSATNLRAAIAAAAVAARNVVSGADTADTLSGTAGVDELFAYGQADLVNAGDGDDTLWGGSGNDTLLGGAGNDLLIGESGDDQMDGGQGSDTYRITGNTAVGFHGYDIYADSGTTGSDTIAALGTGNVDIGFKGNFGPASGIEVIDTTGAAGDVRLLGDSSAQTLDFRGVTMTGTRIVIDAGNGNDVVYGSAGADTLVSHNGEDTLDGAGGDDLYRVTGNTAAGFHGYDAYKDSGTSGTDKIVVAGTTTGAVDIGIRGWNATGIEVVDATGTTGVVRLLDTGDANLLDFRTTTLTGSNLVIDAGSGNDTVYGSAANDTLLGSSGDDLVDGAGGSDTYRVTGNVLAGFHHHDIYKDSGTSGTDTVVVAGTTTGAVDIGIKGWNATGIEVVDATGTTGVVRLLDNGDANLLDFRTTTLTGSNLVIDANYGNDTVYGSAAADTIVSGSGNDQVDGGEGGDTYRVSGNEAAGWSSFQGHDTYQDSGTSGTDKIVVAGTTTGAVDIGVRGWSATGIEQVDATGTTGAVRLLDTWDANLLDFRTTTLTGSNLVIDANYGNDTVYGSAAADTIVGGGGDDVLDGGAGGDTYQVTGNEAGGWTSFRNYDTYQDTGTSGTDRIVGVGTGNVDIGFKGSFGPASGIEVIDATGAAGTVRLLGDGSNSMLDFRGVTLTGSNIVIDGAYGHDVLFGSAQDNVIVSGWGDDTVDGAGGSDTYRITGNTTKDFQGYDVYADTGTSGTDRIVALGTGNVDIGFKGNFSSASGIEVIDATGAAGDVRLLGDGGAQTLDFRGVTLTGTRLVIDGGNGHDVVYGSDAADTLVSHNGEDTLDGAGGGDLYRVTGNTTAGFHGYDTFKDSGTSGTDKIVAVGTGNVDIGLRGGFSAGSGIEVIDGTGAAGTVRLLGENAAETLDFRSVTLTGSNLVIDASGGNDTVYGSAGNDTLLSSSGDDLVDGAGGSDTYRVTGNSLAGFHHHDIYKDSGTSGTDTIVVAGTTTGAVDIGIKGWKDTGIEVVDATGTTGMVRLLDNGDSNLIDLRTTTLTGSNLVIDANYGNDTVYGSAAADTIVGGSGDDVLDGGAGGDTYRVTGNEAGGWKSFHHYDTYQDTGTSGTDRIVALGTGNVDIGLKGHFGSNSGIEVIDATGATGTVRLLGDGSNSTLDFRSVTLTGSNIVIDGAYGHDVIYGSAQGNVIVSGWGDDTVDGAGGSDTYRITGNMARGFQGYDVYADTGTSGTDRIVAAGTGDVDIGFKGNFGPASGIEVIDANGATGTVRLLGDSGAQTLDFRGVTLTGTRLVIDAGNSNDVVYGSGAADTLVSHNGEDTLDGAGGGDTYRVTGNTTAGFHGYDTFKDSGTSGTDKIVAVGNGNVDIGLRGGFGAGSGIEVINGTGATGTVRLLGENAAETLDFRSVTLTGSNLVIDAAGGNDTVYGSAGNDTLLSSSGDDLVDGAGGSDVYRVTGNTTSGFHGHDTYKDSGTSGTDKIVVAGTTTGAVDIGILGWNATGIEQVDATGTTGVVRLLDTGNSNLIDLRTTTLIGSNLVIDANHGNDTVYGSAGSDTIVGNVGNDIVDGGAGGDIYRISGNEAAGSSNFHGHDTYQDTGTSGTDKIVAVGTGDVDIGFRGNFGAAGGIEVIDATGAGGTVRLLGESSSQTLDFRTVTLTGINLVIDAGSGNDTVYGSAASDTLLSGFGEDVLDGAGGSDVYRVTGNTTASFQGYDRYQDSGATGTDRIVAVGTGNVDIGLRGGFGSGSGIEVIDSTGATGTVRLLGEGAAETLDFRSVTLTGSNLVIDAGSGNDTVYGSAGSDTLLSSSGDDLMDGAGGSDVYRVTGNTTTGFHGHDTFKDSGTSGTDTIVVAGTTTGAVDIGIRGWDATGIETVDATGTTGMVRLLDTGSANLIDLRTTTLTGSNLVIDANYGNDTVYGSAAADTIVGGSGNDLLDGGAGGDTYRVTGNEAGGWASFHSFDTYRDSGTSGTDKIVALGTGNVDIGLLASFGSASGIEEIDTTGATGTVRLLGDGSSSTLDFRSVTLTGTNIVIDGAYGHDVLFGSAQDNVIVSGWGDDTVDGAGGGDTFRITGNTTKDFQGYDVYKDTGTSGTDRIVALGTGDVDIGFKGNFGPASGIEVIDATGATGNVRLLGDNGAQTLDFRGVTLTGTRLVIDGGNGNDVVYGSDAADTLVSHNGEDTLDGAGGGDLYRVTGNTTAGFHGYDTFKDSGTSGTDKIVAVGTGNVDIGLRGGFNAGSGIEVIDGTGATGTVRLLGESGAELFDLRSVTMVGSNLVIETGAGNDTVLGSAGADTILSNRGDDRLDGGEGSDLYRVSGSFAAGWSVFSGRDTYADTGTTGTDKIVALGTGDVDIGINDWQSTGIEVIDGTGATGTVRLWANDTANVLDFSTVSFVGGNMLIDGAYGNDTITGSAGADLILGAGNDDLLDGRNGSDIYRVTGNQAGGWSSFHGYDTYRDTGTSGTDKVVALGTGNVDIGVAGWQTTGIEVVDATGATGTVRLLGRDRADVLDFRGTTLTGSNLVIDASYGNDTVFGSAGADTIVGAGNDDLLDGGGAGDTYRVTGNFAGGWNSFHGYDTYRDTGTAGTDRVVAAGTGAVDIGLSGWLDTGIEAIDGTGVTGTVRLLGGDGATVFDFSTTTLTGANLLIDGAGGNDSIIASAGNDQIVGGAGDDTLDGFDGSDTYMVTGNLAGGWRSFQGFDVYRDSGTSGVDTLRAQGAGDVDIGLMGFDGDNGIEVIDTTAVVGQTRLLGSWSDDWLDFSNASILGNRVVIDGSGGTDVIFGSAGNDTILGGGGADSMAGGLGNDVYRVGRGTGLDVVWDYDETEGNLDTVEFGAGIATDQLWFQRLDGFLEVSVIGTWDRVYVMDWDAGPASQIEQFRTADGRVLQSAQVEGLISAMAAFSPPSGGTTTLSQAYQDALAPVIAAAWS